VAEPLSKQENALVVAFVEAPNLDVETAAERVGISVRSARDVLKRPEVRKAIGLAFLSERKDRLEAVRDMLIQNLHQLSCWDPKDLFDAHGELRHIKDMPDTMRAAIKGYKKGRYGDEFQFVDRTAIQLELLRYVGKALGHAETEVLEQTVLEVPEMDSE
jgi:hypothetical protein